MSLIGLEGWWMAPSQMGMWQGSLEVFCGAVLNKKSSLPTKKKKRKKKRGLDLRSPNTVASPSSIMAFNTFLYTPELRINIHLYTTTTLAFPSGFNSHFTSLTHLLPAFVLLLTPHSNPPKHYCGNFSRAAAQHTSIHDETAPVWMFWWSSHLFFFLQPYFWYASEKRERSQRGGSKSAKPEAGRALMECLRAGEGKAVIRIWMEPQERGRGEGKEEGRGERRIMAELLTTPWSAKKDFHSQCAGVDTTADTQRRTGQGDGHRATLS